MASTDENRGVVVHGKYVNLTRESYVRYVSTCGPILSGTCTCALRADGSFVAVSSKPSPEGAEEVVIWTQAIGLTLQANSPSLQIHICSSVDCLCHLPGAEVPSRPLHLRLNAPPRP